MRRRARTKTTIRALKALIDATKRMALKLR
jgi:hypothetical protein